MGALRDGNQPIRAEFSSHVTVQDGLNKLSLPYYTIKIHIA